MKELIPMDDYGIFVDSRDTLRVDSRFVAKEFGKRHDNVLTRIEAIIAPDSGLSRNFAHLNFKASTYKDPTGRALPCYAMTRDGFTLLVMGFTGKKALAFKEAYILRFDEMEAQLRNVVAARMECPRLTDNVKLLHEVPKPYHYSNELNMINGIVLGMTAKQFREKHGIEKGESIRPYLTPEQIEDIERLQHADVGLTLGVPDFQERKRILTECQARRVEERAAAQAE